MIRKLSLNGPKLIINSFVWNILGCGISSLLVKNYLDIDLVNMLMEKFKNKNEGTSLHDRKLQLGNLAI